MKLPIAISFPDIPSVEKLGLGWTHLDSLGLIWTHLDSVVMSLSIYCYFSPRNTLCRKTQSWLDSSGVFLRETERFKCRNKSVSNYVTLTLKENMPDNFEIYADLQDHKVNGHTIQQNIVVTSQRPDSVLVLVLPNCLSVRVDSPLRTDGEHGSADQRSSSLI